MKHHEKLDTVLKYILANNSQQYEIVSEYAFDEPIRSELQSLLSQLSKDGYIFSKERAKTGVHPSYGLVEIACLISPEGVFFATNSSYKRKHQKNIFNVVLEFSKKFGLFINGLLLLAVALGTLYFTKKADDNNTENKELRKQIDSLVNIINGKPVTASDTINKSQHNRKVD